MPRGRGGGGFRGGGMRGGGARIGGFRGRRGTTWGGRRNMTRHFRRGGYQRWYPSRRVWYPSHYRYPYTRYRYYGYPYYASRYYYTYPYTNYYGTYGYGYMPWYYPASYYGGTRTVAYTTEDGIEVAVNEVRVSTDPSVNANEWIERPNAAVHQGPGGAPPTLLYCTTGKPERVPSQAVSTRERPVLALDDAYYQCSA